MNKEAMVAALKNPKLRHSGMAHPAGDTLVEVGADELSRIHGGMGVQPDSTPTVTVTIVVVTVFWCFPGGAS